MQNSRGSSAIRITNVFVIATVVAAVLGVATMTYAEVPCPLAPPVGCLASGKSKISLHDDPDPARGAEDKMSWAWLKGDTIPGGGLGDPINAGTEYSVCMYDGHGGVHTLVKELHIPSGSQWRVKSSNGFQFTDPTMEADGVLSLRLKADAVAVGRSQVKMKVGGVHFNPPGPTFGNPLRYFEQEPSVIVNLVNSVGTCWVTEYLPLDTRENSNKDYRAVIR